MGLQANTNGERIMLAVLAELQQLNTTMGALLKPTPPPPAGITDLKEPKKR